MTAFPRQAVLAAALLATGFSAQATPRDDAAIVAALDTAYQRAVKQNDAVTMDFILADDFALVSGRGQITTKADLLAEARSGEVVYERQDTSERSVRVWGDTAVVTAKLWLKGSYRGEPFDYKLWFSDTYAKTRRGWKYVLGQASLRLPETP